jgi:hypothetical protein
LVFLAAVHAEFPHDAGLARYFQCLCLCIHEALPASAFSSAIDTTACTFPALFQKTLKMSSHVLSQLVLESSCFPRKMTRFAAPPPLLEANELLQLLFLWTSLPEPSPAALDGN